MSSTLVLGSIFAIAFGGSPIQFMPCYQSDNLNQSSNGLMMANYKQVNESEQIRINVDLIINNYFDDIVKDSYFFEKSGYVYKIVDVWQQTVNGINNMVEIRPDKHYQDICLYFLDQRGELVYERSHAAQQLRTIYQPQPCWKTDLNLPKNSQNMMGGWKHQTKFDDYKATIDAVITKEKLKIKGDAYDFNTYYIKDLWTQVVAGTNMLVEIKTDTAPQTDICLRIYDHFGDTSLTDAHKAQWTAGGN